MPNQQKYRIVEHGSGFEPQMLYTPGTCKQEIWFPLNEKGYWLEPESFTMGDISKRLIFVLREDAESVIDLAKKINGDPT